MKRLWYRLLAWMFRVGRDTRLRIELIDSLDGPVDRIVEVHGTIVVFTRRSAYRVWYDYSHIGLRMRRVV